MIKLERLMLPSFPSWEFPLSRCGRSVVSSLNFRQVSADPGCMGGSRSHEYHYRSPAGEASLYTCRPCGHSSADMQGSCPACGSQAIATEKSIEIAHTFSLGSRYSDPLKAVFSDSDRSKKTLHMGCFGIGVTRLLAAVAGCRFDDRGIIWPAAIAPYETCIVSLLKAESDSDIKWIESVCRKFPGAILDDRVGVNAGIKLYDARFRGFPKMVVVGEAGKDQGYVEVFDREGDDVAKRIPIEI